jgi:type IV pilus assembly protein PilA
MMNCPFCAKQISELARKCEWCQADLTSYAPPGSPTGPPQTSGKAIASMICGFFAWFLPTAIVAVVLGHISSSEIRKSRGQLRGSGMATTGMVLGYAGVALLPVILIIAAIAIPNLLRSKMAANEASAVSSLRSLTVACITYSSTYERGYPAQLANLGPSAHPSADAAGLIDSALAGGQTTGYLFFYRPGPAIKGAIDSYTINADPVAPNTTGTRHFFTDESGVIRATTDGAASSKSPPIS